MKIMFQKKIHDQKFDHQRSDRELPLRSKNPRRVIWDHDLSSIWDFWILQTQRSENFGIRDFNHLIFIADSERTQKWLFFAASPLNRNGRGIIGKFLRGVLALLKEFGSGIENMGASS